jgi:polar amino acid transport system substrate-binding protein
VIGANKKEAEHLVTGAEPVAEPQFALFARKDNPWKYDSLRSLSGIRLGAIEGYSYWNSLDDYIKKISAPALKTYTGDTPLAEAMADLADGKIDALPESVLVFIWAAKSSGRKFADFRIAYTEASEPIYVAFTNNELGRNRARMFDRGLRKLKDSGRFDAILTSYGFATTKQ